MSKHRVGTGGGGHSGHQRSRAPTEGTIVEEIRGVQNRFRPDMHLYHDRDHGGTLPVGGSGPSSANERHMIKQDLLANPDKYGFSGINATYSLGSDEIDVIRDRQKQLQQAGFFEWLSTMVDIREPGMLSWLNDLVPEYAEAQMSQLKSNQELYAIATKIKNFGIQSREDMMFQYMLDTGQIRDSRKYKPDLYIPGWLSPKGSVYSNADGSARTFDKANLGDYAPRAPNFRPRGFWWADVAGTPATTNSFGGWPEAIGAATEQAPDFS